MARVSETLDDAITNAVAEIARESLSISMAGDGPWWQPAGRKLGGIPYHEWTWDDLDVCRLESQRMMTHNEFGIGGTTKRIDYVVDQGFKYSIVESQGEVVQKTDIEQLNEYLELITSANSFPELEAEIVARMDRDGEAFLRLFWNDDGIVDVRFIEPERVRPGPGADTSMNSIERWGIQVEPHDAKRITGYWVEPNIGETPELVPEAEIVHIIHNNGGAIPRGIPVYQPVFENLRRCEDLLTGMSSIAKARAKIALIRKIAGLNAVKAENIKSRLTTGTQQNPDGTVRNVSIDEYPFGSVLRVNADETFEFPSSNVGAADLIQVLQADLRSIASLLSMPEWMFTGLADQKYSNAFVVEAPTLKAFRRLQGKLVKGLATGRYKSQASVLWRCLRMAAERDVISKEVLAKCKVKCVPPSLEARDKQSESSVNKTYLDAGVIDKQTVQESIGLDPVETNRRIAAEKAAAPPAPPMIPGAKPPAGPLPPKLTKVGESWYTRRALEWIAEGYDRSHLIKTKIIDRNNVARTVYKRPAKLKPRQPQEYKVEPPKKPTMYDITKQVFGPPVVRMERANKDLPDLTRGYLKSPTGIDAVREYGGAGAGINEHLWADKPIPEKFQEMDADLQDIFADTPKLPKPITTYRGMSTDSDKADFARFQELAKSGGEWQTKGYMSTTTKAANVARGGDFGGDGIVYEIEANHGIDVGPVGLIGASSQAELLLNKGSRFKVVGATQVDRFKYRVKLIQVSSGGDAVQVGESWYSLDALEWITEGRDRSHLVKVKRQDVNGVYRFVYVRPAGYDKTGSEHGKGKQSPEKKASQRSEAEHSAHVEQLAATAQKIKAGTHTPDELKSFTDGLSALTVAEIAGIKQQLGVKGGKVKADHIAKVAAFAQQQRVDKPIQLTDYEVDRKGEIASNALFGKVPTAQEFAKLGCAVDGAKLAVEGYVEDGVHSISLYARSDASESDGGKVGMRSSRQIYRDHKGNLICENFSFRNNSAVTGKSGTELLRDQVQELRKWGVKEIETVGVGNKTTAALPASDLKSENGYYTWPRLGYSGEMSEDQFKELPANIQTAMGENRDVRKLFDDVPGGPEAWKEHGSDISLRFDLSDNSVNMVALQKYLSKRGL